jgi:hypothetical protein
VIALEPDTDPLAHLDLAALLTIWAQLAEPQQAACAAYRGVGVNDLKVLRAVFHGVQQGHRGATDVSPVQPPTPIGSAAWNPGAASGTCEGQPACPCPSPSP